MSTSEVHRPNPETHPHVRFWNKPDYLKWLDTAGADSGDRGKLPFLEDENGDPVPEAMIDSIRKSLRTAWSELADRKLAPSTWGKLSASGAQLVNGIMERAHPLFRLANNSWKLDYLATMSYSSWRRTHLDDFGSHRKGKKGDNDNDNDDNDNDKESDEKPQPTISRGKKRRQHFKTEVAEKKTKGTC
jgi:hypothetical protein